MTFGVTFSNNGLSRVLDGQRLVPQLIGVYNMANYPYFDSDDTAGAHPGWISRVYNFDWVGSGWQNRPVVIFTTLPNQGLDVYSNGGRVMYKPGTTFTPPVWYVFALDYVTLSGQNIGLKLWRPNSGELMYDSANFHLNLKTIMTLTVDDFAGDKNLHAPQGAVRSFVGDLPATGAYKLSELTMYREYGTRFDGYGDWRAAPFYRVRGNTVDTLMLAFDREYLADETYNGGNAGYDHIYRGNVNKLVTLVVDATMYN